MLMIARGGMAVDEGSVDEVLRESFPASDPPSWTSSLVDSGLGRPSAPPIEAPARGRDDVEGGRARAANVRVDPSVSRGPVILRVIRSAGDAIGAGLLTGIGVLLVGAVIALVVRGILEAITWVVTMGRG